MKNWKTTLAGCATAGVYAAFAYLQNGGLEPKEAAIVAGVAILGVLAKDLDVTGGKVEQ